MQKSDSTASVVGEPVAVQEKVEVKLLAPHTHAGQPKVAGDILLLRSDQARWLINEGRAAAT